MLTKVVPRRTLIGIPLALCIAFAAQQPWSKDPSQWSKADVDRILNSSPWAQSAEARFSVTGEDEQDPRAALPPPAATTTMAGRQGVTDGAWDGGVGRMPRGGTPTLPVAVRWKSALPVREALTKTDPNRRSPFLDRAPTEYILSIEGLVAAQKSGQLDDPADRQRMLEGVMTMSRLTYRGHLLRPDDAQLDSKSGELYLFFPRSEPIQEKDKEVRFDTRYGSLLVTKVFRLKDMAYNGRLEL